MERPERVAPDFRIALIGQAAFGESVLKALASHGEHIVGVFCPPDKGAKRVDPLKTAAGELKLPVHQFARMRDHEAIDAFTALRADLGVMAFVTDIVPHEILTAPNEDTIQFHPSLLPRHRGPSSMNWPIIQGETRTGLSIFWPDEGLDTGPVLLQKKADIGPDETLGSLYFDKLFPLGVDAMIEAVGLVKNGNAPRIPQDESQVTYEGWCREADVIVSWDEPVARVYNLIRGSDPSPGAGTTLSGTPIKIFKTSIKHGPTDAAPGEVLEVTDEGFSVAAQDGAVLIRRVQPDGSRKLSASEWARSTNLIAGARFGEY